MTQITNAISTYYREVIAKTAICLEEGDSVTTIYPLDRVHFVVGAGLGFLFLIEKTTKVFYYLMRIIFTCNRNENNVRELRFNAFSILTYAGAIPIGYLGAFFPKTVNEKFLNIPANRLIRRRPLTALLMLDSSMKYKNHFR